MKFLTQSFDSLPPRERILVAAHALFYRDGIRATGVDRIIEQSSVSKVTFYRQYASKDDLIRTYLDYRHGRWISWFQNNLSEKTAAGSSATEALVSTLKSWFMQPDFRGCAFLNAVAEFGSSDHGILEIVCRHKQEMSSVLNVFFSKGFVSVGHTLSLLIDGAIVHAQMGRPIDEVVENFKESVDAIVAR
jgi:AcrR family transcriptional regulator